MNGLAEGSCFLVNSNGASFKIAVSDAGIRRLEMPGGLTELDAGTRCGFEVRGGPVPDRQHGWLLMAAEYLSDTLQGRRPSKRPPIDTGELSVFCERVLETTARIGWGERETYGWIASRIGAEGSARAVGNALAKNPVPLLIPCHRVVRADGSPGGYCGGVKLKKWLLELESKQ